MDLFIFVKIAGFLKREHKALSVLMLFFFLISCSTTPPVPPPMPMYQIKDLEWIANQKDFNFFFPIDRYQCDPQGAPLVKSILDSTMCENVSFQYLKEGAFKEVGGIGRFSFTMRAGESFEYIMPVELCDLSRGLAVSFVFKSNVLKSGNISLKIGDHKTTQTVSRSQSIDIEDAWQRIYFEFSDFNEINKDAITTISIIFTAEQDVQGEILIDNVFVLGEKHFTQTSKEDNFAIFSDEPLALSKEDLLQTSDADLLLLIAQKTWQYFSVTVDKETKIPTDRVDFTGIRRAHHYTSTTNIGLYMVACVAAHRLGFIAEEEMQVRLKDVLTVLKQLTRWKNFFYNYYHTTTLEPVDPFISSIDNGWLAIGLAVVREVVEGEEKDICSRLIEEMDFGLFYKEDLGHINLGYHTDKGIFSPYDYGLLCTEARAVSFFAIGKEDVPLNHWFRLNRTFPVEWDWQNSKPYGAEKYYMGEKIFSGFYEYENLQIVPSWGGSLFEFLMPTLFIDEAGLAPKALGKNDKRAALAHMRYAATQGYEIWGISPCADPGRLKGGYSEYGVAPIGVKGYPDKGVITPHASILALSLCPEEVTLNIRNMIEKYPEIFSQYGFFDAVNVKTGKVAKTYLCLDQSMILISICNYLTGNKIVELFHQSKYVKPAERLLKIEEFY
jgi:hypothetical protein